MLALVGVNVDWVASAAPGVYVTVDWVWLLVPLLTAEPPRVATNTPLPVAVGDVTVDVYVPLLLSVTEPIVPVPDCFVIATVDPPLVKLFPLTSFAWTVNTCVLLPFAVMLELAGANVDCAASAAPGVYVTVACVWLPVPLFTGDPANVATNTPLPVAVGDVTVACVWLPPPLLTAEPPSVATNTPLPVVAGDVTVAEYVPLLLSVTEPIVPVPVCLVIATVAPPDVRLLPLASFAWTVRTCVLLPSAEMLALVGVS